MGELASIITAVATAVGTPGLTWLVMNKMQKIQIKEIKELHALQIGHMEENCKKCKAGLDEKIGCLDQSVDGLDGRQKTLREKDLPANYVKRRELEALEKKHEKEVEIIHKRIEKYHPAT